MMTKSRQWRRTLATWCGVLFLAVAAALDNVTIAGNDYCILLLVTGATAVMSLGAILYAVLGSRNMLMIVLAILLIIDFAILCDVIQRALGARI
jgi:hypothetical protein